ncbi:TlpA disulfide reductase family protein [Aequorivita lipolytica]|uniref:AhpC/TSA family protein n=1 Tax=Aequorivita lipolytica TaxID=153267 RepID=A0A5C6YQR6_9FLAO|nr:TlpA disulfide reductase family protein [Aequorivita lipolytica]TXD69685.1 AhpC/TSA family protein [Aequorivita lipolytica]SRX51181.1 Thiol-disulfide oxidoreductase ResA [Aequorivita lipolytica]
MRLILASLITIALISCNKETNTYKLEGDAVGFADGTEIYVYTLENKQPKILDTIAVTEGKFSATYPKSDVPNLNFLRFNEVNGSILYFPENEDMKATIYKDSIQASRVTGGKQNEAYGAFVDKMTAFNKRKQASMERFREARQANDTATIAEIQSQNLNIVGEETEYKKQFLKDNGNSLFAVMLISEMVGRKELTPEEASEHLEKLHPKIASSEIVQDLKTNLETMKKAEVGSAAPNFSAPTPSGETMSLKDALGKYTIIDFWASWCKPCRIENPNVVKVYNEYHDKGLNIISVSLDKAEQKDKWLQAIKDDKMDWYHVSNLQFWQDPIAVQYNVRSIPATFLLDENGMIIDKDLRGAALEAKIATLFEGQ